MPSRSKPALDDAAQKRQRRSRSRHAGSIADYPSKQGQRWKFQIYVPRDPEKPELGEFRITRGGLKNLDGAQAALAEALKKKAQNERSQGKVPTIGDYADQWAAGLPLQNSTMQGYRKIIRNHITPQLGDIRLDKLTATRLDSTASPGSRSRVSARARDPAAGARGPPKVVQERLGHSTITTTMNIYSHVTPAMQKAQ